MESDYERKKRLEESIFCPRIKIVEHHYARKENGYNDHFTVLCLEKVCPFARCRNVVCLSHNNGLHIIAKDKIAHFEIEED